MKAAEFIKIVSPVAIKLWMEGSTIFPSVRIAQAMHETGIKIHPWNNLVGFKVGKGKLTPYWDGATVGKGTFEEVNGKDIKIFANWRVYKTIELCFQDQDYLFEWSNYDNVRAAKTPEAQCRSFIESPYHYATDSEYPQGLLRHLNDNNLKQYDREAVSNMQEIKDLQASQKAQDARLEKLEGLTAGLVKTAPPKWFITEFGARALDGIVTDLTGDEGFWRDTAVVLRLKNK